MTTVAAPRLTSTSLDLPPDLYGYAAMHLGMHRDAARLVRTLDATPADPARLERWWTAYRDVIVRHHTREDDLIWPALADADPTFTAEIASMHDDHAELDAAMHRLDIALTAMPVWPEALDEARRAAVAFREVLGDHVAREEAVAFHRLAGRPRLWADIEQRIEAGMRPREAAFEFPWALDGLHPDRVAHLMRRVPRPLRPVTRWVWQPRYARLVAAAHVTGETA
jgi:hypothetical protein